MQVPPIRVVPANKGAGELPIAGTLFEFTDNTLLGRTAANKRLPIMECAFFAHTRPVTENRLLAKIGVRLKPASRGHSIRVRKMRLLPRPAFALALPRLRWYGTTM